MNLVRANYTFTVHLSPFTVRYPFTQHLARTSRLLKLSAGFTVIPVASWLMDQGKCMVKGKRKMVNGFIGSHQ